MRRTMSRFVPAMALFAISLSPSTHANEPAPAEAVISLPASALPLLDGSRTASERLAVCADRPLAKPFISSVSTRPPCRGSPKVSMRTCTVARASYATIRKRTRASGCARGTGTGAVMLARPIDAHDTCAPCLGDDRSALLTDIRTLLGATADPSSTHSPHGRAASDWLADALA